MDGYLAELARVGGLYPAQLAVTFILPTCALGVLLYALGRRHRASAGGSGSNSRELVNRLLDLGSCVLAEDSYDLEQLRAEGLPAHLQEAVAQLRDQGRRYFALLRKANQLDPGTIEVYSRAYADVSPDKVRVMWLEAKDKYNACRAQAVALRIEIMTGITRLEALLQ